MREPINFARGKFLGHVNLVIEDDVAVCELLAEDYDLLTGARSLQRAVSEFLIKPITTNYLSIEEEVLESSNTGPLLEFHAALQTEGDEKEIVVRQVE